MTILETFIRLRDDLKIWVVNNLNQKANISYVDEKFDSISEFDPTEIQEAIDANTAAIDTKVDNVDGKGLSTNDYTTAEKDKLRDIEANANFYEHPEHASYSSGLYKVTVDGFGHVSSAAPADKEDLIALGIPAQDTTYDTEISDFEKRISYIEDDFIGVDGKFVNLFNDFAEYKEQNNNAIADNASKVQANQQAIENIQNDYLTSTDKTQLEDNITKVSDKATDNAVAIEILNGEGDGSVKQSIDNAFNEFAANVTNDDVINTYKELIDYAAVHGPEFTELVGEVDNINTHVGEVESDLSDYKTAVSDQFTEVDTTINNHVTNINNPHNVTKNQVGLDQVDNTSDMDKPISHAVDEALKGKADSEHIHEIGQINNLQDSLDELQAGIDTIVEDVEAKADAEHEHNDLYYTKDEILESITVEDIDNICEFASSDGVDLVNVATEQWVRQNYQPKGNYALKSEIPNVPVQSVNGKTGAVNLTADDIGALPADTVIPSIDGLATETSVSSQVNAAMNTLREEILGGEW